MKIDIEDVHLGYQTVDLSVLEGKPSNPPVTGVLKKRLDEF